MPRSKPYTLPATYVGCTCHMENVYVLTAHADFCRGASSVAPSHASKFVKSGHVDVPIVLSTPISGATRNGFCCTTTE
jgi:hypothetical protein